MKTYMMRMSTNLRGVPWEHTFSQSSDEMALDWAKRHASLLARDYRAFMGLTIWLMPEQKCIGHIYVEASFTARVRDVN